MTRAWSRRPQAASAADRGYGEAWRKVRLLVLERDGWWCQVRVSPKCVPNLRYGKRNAHVDHIVAVALGGAHLDPSNLRACCQRCNLLLGAQLGRERQIAAMLPPPPRRPYRVY